MNLYRPDKSNRESVQTIVTKRHELPECWIAWTDGACEPNPGKGGWGFRLEGLDGELMAEDCGGLIETTNNRMELEAINRALATARWCDVIVRTDSQLCVLCAVGRWRRKTNLDQWRELDKLCEGRRVVFEWWRGHVGTPGNERADELAQIGRQDAISQSDLYLAY